MKPKTRVWLRGMASAIVGGGASSIVSTFTANMVAPAQFNLYDAKGIAGFFSMASACFLVNGILSLCFYLAKSPLPPDNGDHAVNDKD